MGVQSTDKLTIGLIVDDTIDKPDGVQQYVQIIGRWLSSQGHEVHYITGESHRTDIANIHSLSRNLRVRFNGNGLTIPLWAPSKAIKQLYNDVSFDVLHVMMPHSPMLAQRVIIRAPKSVAAVGTFHILPNSKWVGVLTGVLGKWLHPSLQRLVSTVAVSTVARDFAHATFGINPTVIPNPIETNKFIGASGLPVYEATPTIVFVNRLVERKGCIYLLKAVAKMIQSGRYAGPLKVVICGKGPLRPALEAFVAANKLTDIVEFAGYVSEEDKPHYIASADLAVYPSTGGESFGIVLIEAMAAARGAVLAGDNPGYRSVIGDHPKQLFEPKDTAAFAELIANFLLDKADRDAAHAWQQQAVGQYDIEVVGNKLVNMYYDALQQQRVVR